MLQILINNLFLCFITASKYHYIVTSIAEKSKCIRFSFNFPNELDFSTKRKNISNVKYQILDEMYNVYEGIKINLYGNSILFEVKCNEKITVNYFKAFSFLVSTVSLQLNKK